MAPKKPRTTRVPDRSRLSIADEALLVARLLRTYGASADRVPRFGIDPDEERQAWLQTRSRPVRDVPRYVLDYALAVLEMIPPPRTKPLSLDRQLTEWVRRLAVPCGSVAESARYVATLHLQRVAYEAARHAAEQAGDDDPTKYETEPPVDADAIEVLAEKLRRRIYKTARRKRDVPKSG
jgi:hypothetical protein